MVQKAISLLFAGLFILMAFSMMSMAQDEGDEKGLAEWTFMVYLDADNNLEDAGVHDLNEMETAGSTEKVNIVVEMDRHPDYDTTNGDWTTTKRFLVEKDAANGEIISEELMDLGEANMGDPATVVDFVRWAVDNYPAKKYLIDFWDHGGAFWGAEWDESNPADGKDYDVLRLPELKTAMQGVEEVLGRNIDIVAFDACLMGEAEVQYEFRDTADIGIGSGYVEPGEGWPYDQILPELVSNPEMTPVDLATIIVDRYVDSYHDAASDPDDTTAITMTAFDLSKMGELGYSVNQLADALAVHASWVPVVGEGGHWFQMEQARQDTNSYDWGYGVQAAPGNQFPIDPTGYCMYDLIDLAANMKRYIPRELDIASGADAASTAAKASIIHARITGYQDAVKGANGITIYYPSGYDTQYSEMYDDVDFAFDTFWDDFLKAYVKKTAMDKTPPGVVISSPGDDAMFDVGTGQVVVQGKAFDLQGAVAYVEASVDGGPWMKVNGTEIWTFKFDTGLAGVGNHTITVRANDGSENSPEISLKLKVVEPRKEERSFVSGNNIFIPISIVALVVALVVLALMTGRFVTKRRAERYDDEESEDGYDAPMMDRKGTTNGGPPGG